MSGFGAKLSRHVLGMKFMRNKSKDQAVKSEKVTSNSAGTSTSSVKLESSSKVKSEPTATTSSPVVEELWSYNQCERYIFGRQSYGGFNPTVEKNVKKGIWRPFYLDDQDPPVESSDDEDTKKQSDVDVSDEEMAKTYGSLIGTLAKRFRGKDKGKGKKNKKFKEKAYDKKPKWGKKFNKKSEEGDERGGKRGNAKRHRESTGSNFQGEDERHQQHTPSGNSKRNYDGGDNEDVNVPPQKRRKFLKPSD